MFGGECGPLEQQVMIEPRDINQSRRRDGVDAFSWLGMDHRRI